MKGLFLYLLKLSRDRLWGDILIKMKDGKIIKVGVNQDSLLDTLPKLDGDPELEKMLSEVMDPPPTNPAPLPPYAKRSQGWMR